MNTKTKNIPLWSIGRFTINIKKNSNTTFESKIRSIRLWSIGYLIIAIILLIAFQKTIWFWITPAVLICTFLSVMYSVYTYKKILNGEKILNCDKNGGFLLFTAFSSMACLLPITSKLGSLRYAWGLPMLIIIIILYAIIIPLLQDLFVEKSNKTFAIAHIILDHEGRGITD